MFQKNGATMHQRLMKSVSLHQIQAPLETIKEMLMNYVQDLVAKLLTEHPLQLNQQLLSGQLPPNMVPMILML